MLQLVWQLKHARMSWNRPRNEENAEEITEETDTNEDTEEETEAVAPQQVSPPEEICHENVDVPLQAAAAVTVINDDKDKVCRFCFGDSTEGKMIQPCNCTGTQANVHKECLVRWLQERWTVKCEICNARYNYSWYFLPFSEWRLPRPLWNIEPSLRTLADEVLLESLLITIICLLTMNMFKRLINTNTVMLVRNKKDPKVFSRKKRQIHERTNRH